MYVIAERVEAVFVNAGSYVIRPKSSSSTLIWRKSIARTVPSVISISYVLPVRLSVTDSVSWAVATPPAWPSPAWVSSLMHLSLRSAHGPPAGQRLRATSRGADRARTRVGAWAGGARAARPGRLAPAGRLARRRARRAARDRRADRGGRARGAVGGPADGGAPAPGVRGGDARAARRRARAGGADRGAVRGGPRAGCAAERGRRSLPDAPGGRALAAVPLRAQVAPKALGAACCRGVLRTLGQR